VRVSRELHDDTGQALTLLLVRLQLVENMVRDDEVRRELAELRALVADTLDGVRRLALDLAPSALDDLGLAAAIRWLVRRVEEETDLEVETTVDCDGAGLEREVAIAVFRVAQEALTNVVRHAHARHLRVRLVRRAHTLVLTVEDDGRGFDTAAIRSRPASSVGLFGMTERVALIGGELAISSAAGGGTIVRANVPLEART
jgi:signal transduction histidine kinase